ncbi:hypothetical protein [Ancylobacter sp. IITR112]|uniref:hypothetical protein n=1 Tax=Ancylobacter sp. IITR112 TaxID=3138073 RepID=UPI00352A2861
MINAKTASAAVLAAMLALSGPAFAQSSGTGGSSSSAGASDSGTSGGNTGGSATGSGTTDSRTTDGMNPAAGAGMESEGRNTTTGTMGSSSTDNPGMKDQKGDTKANRDCSSTQTPC